MARYASFPDEALPSWSDTCSAPGCRNTLDFVLIDPDATHLRTPFCRQHFAELVRQDPGLLLGLLVELAGALRHHNLL